MPQLDADNEIVYIVVYKCYTQQKYPYCGISLESDITQSNRKLVVYPKGVGYKYKQYFISHRSNKCHENHYVVIVTYFYLIHNDQGTMCGEKKYNKKRAFHKTVSL